MSYEYSAFIQYTDKDDPLRLASLTKAATVTAYEGGDFDTIAGASIANVTTGLYKVKVTHGALEPVLFKVIPHNDEKDDFPDVVVMAEEVRFIADDILADTGDLKTRLTAGRADYLDKLNVAGVLANTNNADTFKANVASLALEATLTAIKGASWSNQTLKAIGDKTTNLPASPAGVGAAMTLTSAYDAAKSAASQTSVNAIPTTPLLAGNYTAPDNAGITAIKAKTDNLPNSPAATGDAMTLTSAYDNAKDDVLTPLATVDGKADAIKAKTDKIPNTPAEAGEYTTALTDIQTDLDNPGQYKADVSGLAKTTDLSGLAKTSDLSGLAEKTDIPSDYAKANDLSGLAKTTDITALNNLSAAEMLNEVVVGTFTLREILTILAAKSDGYPATGGGTTTITYGGIDGTPGVIVETVDEDGNRSKVEFNL